eukprot:TRINITY_DN5797_c1_g1_i1.p2 TRINITY_DN5797_c1_g1~~TRINITY_DN5797_c1_g1_i1.p2  ORF type:complete len:125 (-),score=0.82 TRINITY_DN5797_c1_g1_i1:44-418(-)
MRRWKRMSRLFIYFLEGGGEDVKSLVALRLKRIIVWFHPPREKINEPILEEEKKKKEKENRGFAGASQKQQPSGYGKGTHHTTLTPPSILFSIDEREKVDAGGEGFETIKTPSIICDKNLDCHY